MDEQTACITQHAPLCVCVCVGVCVRVCGTLIGQPGGLYNFSLLNVFSPPHIPYFIYL